MSLRISFIEFGFNLGPNSDEAGEDESVFSAFVGGSKSKLLSMFDSAAEDKPPSDDSDEHLKLFQHSA